MWFCDELKHVHDGRHFPSQMTTGCNVSVSNLRNAVLMGMDSQNTTRFTFPWKRCCINRVLETNLRLSLLLTWGRSSLEGLWFVHSLQKKWTRLKGLELSSGVKRKPSLGVKNKIHILSNIKRPRSTTKVDDHRTLSLMEKHSETSQKYKDAFVNVNTESLQQSANHWEHSTKGGCSEGKTKHLQGGNSEFNMRS